MVTAPLESKPKRRLCFARKIDRKKVQAMRRQGLPVTDIAKHQGVNVSTIWRFLERSDEEQRGIDRFKLNRADEFTRLQGMAIGVQHDIIKLIADDVLSCSSWPRENARVSPTPKRSWTSSRRNGTPKKAGQSPAS